MLHERHNGSVIALFANYTFIYLLYFVCIRLPVRSVEEKIAVNGSLQSGLNMAYTVRKINMKY